jgi:hypothetical protein
MGKPDLPKNGGRVYTQHDFINFIVYGPKAKNNKERDSAVVRLMSAMVERINCAASSNRLRK